MKLSSIMRYVLDDAKSTFVALDKEMQFLENYISLQRVRLTEKSSVNFATQGNTANKKMAPLLLIAFVENAFKYGVSTHQPAVIDIQLKVTDSHLSFAVANQKFTTAQAAPDNTGIGLNNAKRRLELLYPNKHSLLIEDNAHSFLITLTLNLL